jgi:hypothetical protein
LYSKSGPNILSAPSDAKLPKREYSFKSLTKKQRERPLILGEAWEEIPPKRYEKVRARSLFLEENSQNSLPKKKKKQGNPVQVVRVFLGICTSWSSVPHLR